MITPELRKRMENASRGRVFVGSEFEEREFWCKLAGERVDVIRDLLKVNDASERLKTKDGIEVKHGMNVWPQHEIEGEMGAIVRLTLTDNATGDITIHGDTANITKCFALRPPKQEPVVDCCDFGKSSIYLNEELDGWHVHDWNLEDKPATHCICGVLLPELEREHDD